MKFFSEKQGLEKLDRLKTNFAERIRSEFEHNAKSCITCETRGACCLDAHFVNVRISRLEAVAINNTLADLSHELRERIYRRIEATIEKYRLDEPSPDDYRTYACPLFERGMGCLVHLKGKPLPCIQHACYENKNDLPPDELLAAQETLVDDLNRKVFGKTFGLRMLPLAIRGRQSD